MGLGRSLYEALLMILAEQGFHNAYAGITLPNDPSVAFHEALGFGHLGTYRRVGFKLGAWWDVSWYARELQGDPDRTPGELREVTSILDRPRVESALS